jgi:hypothetical protein
MDHRTGPVMASRSSRTLSRQRVDTINVPPTLDERMYCGHPSACKISDGTDPQRIVNAPVYVA